MWHRVCASTWVIAAAAVTTAGGPAASAGQGLPPLECALSDDPGVAIVVCTVAGDEGAVASLVTAILLGDGSERVLSTTQTIVGDRADLTLSLPDGAVGITALALVDGVQTGTVQVDVPEVEPAGLGFLDVTIASTAFGILIVGALVVYISARRRGTANRQSAMRRGESS